MSHWLSSLGFETGRRQVGDRRDKQRRNEAGSLIGTANVDHQAGQLRLIGSIASAAARHIGQRQGENQRLLDCQWNRTTTSAVHADNSEGVRVKQAGSRTRRSTQAETSQRCGRTLAAGEELELLPLPQISLAVLFHSWLAVIVSGRLPLHSLSSVKDQQFLRLPGARTPRSHLSSNTQASTQRFPFMIGAVK